MAIVAQYLFGSHARKDFSFGSDVDLLSITNEGVFRSENFGLVNVSIYPEGRFLDAAAAGDLFVLHIFLEAKLIYDYAGFHRRFLRTFRYKKDYQLDIKRASDLAWFLVRHGGKFSDMSLLNRRVAWCARTILIAKYAAMGNPVFSASVLAKLEGSVVVERLMARKHDIAFDFNALSDLEDFLGSQKISEPKSMIDTPLKDIWWHFRLTNNTIALKAFDAVISSVSRDIYRIDDNSYLRFAP